MHFKQQLLAVVKMIRKLGITEQDLMVIHYSCGPPTSSYGMDNTVTTKSQHHLQALECFSEEYIKSHNLTGAVLGL